MRIPQPAEKKIRGGKGEAAGGKRGRVGGCCWVAFALALFLPLALPLSVFVSFSLFHTLSHTNTHTHSLEVVDEKGAGIEASKKNELNCIFVVNIARLALQRNRGAEGVRKIPGVGDFHWDKPKISEHPTKPTLYIGYTIFGIIA